MQRKKKISIVVFAVLILGVLTVNLVLGANSMPGANSLSVGEEAPVLEVTDDIEELIKMAPRTLQEAELEIIPVRARFLMWTYDGVHIMWGFCGNGRFTGTDNLGNRCWGIYGKGVFAGFYEGEFFWGRYGNGTWKAQDLFKPGHTHGKYILFPTILPNTTTENIQ